ncbi:MAG TPA: hypothetical protein VGB09_10320, partial [Candidatus Binatia bacterium]
ENCLSLVSGVFSAPDCAAFRSGYSVLCAFSSIGHRCPVGGTPVEDSGETAGYWGGAHTLDSPDVEKFFRPTSAAV